MNGAFGPGTRFGDFEVIEVAGRGGMGVVYKARQVSLHRTVALKVVAPEVSADEGFRKRFSHEARLAAAIDHPHVVSVYGAGEHEGHAYIAMQWVEGSGLDHELAGTGALAPLRACTIVAQIAGALDAAAAAGLLHRDVKPPNILLRSIGGSDHAYLTDFGIARQSGVVGTAGGLTATGQVVGTFHYMGPELFRGEKADARTDLYALGCVLFESLTGRRPFPRDTDASLMWAHINDPRPKPSEVNPALEPFDEVVAKAMSVDPNERYQSGSDLAAAAFTALGGAAPGTREAVTKPLAGAEATVAHASAPADRPQPPAPPSPPAPAASPAPSSQPSRRSPALVLIGAVLVLALAGAGLVGAGVIGGEEDPDSPPAVSTETGDDADDPGPVTTETTEPDNTSTTGGDGDGEEPVQGPTPEEDKEAIVGVLQAYADAYSARSTDGLRAIFTPDVTRHGLRSGGCSDDAGIEDVLSAYQEQFSGGTGTYTLPGLGPGSVQLNGNNALAPVTYQFTGGPGGTITFTLTRDAEGSPWLISAVDATCG